MRDTTDYTIIQEEIEEEVIPEIEEPEDQEDLPPTIEDDPEERKYDIPAFLRGN